jgi:hypothetical protein
VKRSFENSKCPTPVGATGKEVWALLKDKGLSNAKELALELQLEKSVFSKEYLSKETIKVLAKYQGLRVEWLLFKEGEPFVQDVMYNIPVPGSQANEPDEDYTVHQKISSLDLRIQAIENMLRIAKK